ncbi:MAG: dTDP-4-dehydrorhamnose 3,5-epimerase family protein, partial [Bacteroidia bacterium]|nr:dTDP-4-dehydrorhamnose 3,5-epimerase family protein [Bacteroidia bacterium]
MGFRRVDTPLDGLILIQPDVFSDSRGHFLEIFHAEAFREIGLGHLQFVQDNLSWSTHGVIRGMHFQR